MKKPTAKERQATVDEIMARLDREEEIRNTRYHQGCGGTCTRNSCYWTCSECGDDFIETYELEGNS